MSNTPLLLAIDLGTSGPKVALYTATGELLAGASAPTPLIFLPNGGVEQAPAVWWEAICTATQRVLATVDGAAARVTGIGVTTQWSGTVPLGADGKPVGNAIIWMDARGARHIRQVTGGFPTFAGYGARKLWTWLRKTGGIPGHSGKDSIAHILYLRQEEPDRYAATLKFLEPKDYINYKLTGRMVSTGETMTLHWITDNRTIDHIHYDDELLRLAGLERARLPDELLRSIDVVGTLTPAAAADLGLSTQVKVVAGAPDIHTAAVGSGAVADFAAHCYIGTSAWLSCHVPFKRTDILHNMAALPSALPGRYLLINEHEIAGAALNFLRDRIFFADDALMRNPPPEDVFARLEAAAAAAPPGSNRVLFTPWLNGERSPVDDHTVRGGWHNLSLRTTRHDLVRSVYEGVALNARWLQVYVEKFIRRPLTEVRMVGGGARSDLWCQLHADVLQRPVLQVADPLHVNTRGAAFLAAVGLGYLRLDELAALTPVAHRYEPRPALAALYDELFGEFVAIYRRTHSIYRRLNHGHESEV
ncbi:MAG TPA: xylulose kinase [Chloroflexi bacterium]|nr:xylulose kinase [Chloroflexota bacterium]HHW86874.1 xylulose kinase [Chloroflexota bacterium]